MQDTVILNILYTVFHSLIFSKMEYIPPQLQNIDMCESCSSNKVHLSKDKMLLYCQFRDCPRNNANSNLPRTALTTMSSYGVLGLKYAPETGKVTTGIN